MPTWSTKEVCIAREIPSIERFAPIYLKTLNNPEATREERGHVNREWTKLSLYRPEKFDEYFSKPSSRRVVPRRLDYYSYQELPTFDLTDALADVLVPTIVCCGRHDAQCPVDCSVEIADQIPDAQLVVFEESNHSPFLEEAPAFADVVTNFAQLTLRRSFG